jgi:hypothetical protein
MQWACVLSLVLSGLIPLGIVAEEKPLIPVEAIKHVNEVVTVQMLVKATKDRLEKRGEIYLDSEEDYWDRKNLGIVITKAGAAKFKKAGVEEPSVHFKGKLVRVKGKVILKDQRPRIEVDDPKQIQIVEKERKPEQT